MKYRATGLIVLSSSALLIAATPITANAMATFFVNPLSLNGFQLNIVQSSPQVTLNTQGAANNQASVIAGSGKPMGTIFFGGAPIETVNVSYVINPLSRAPGHVLISNYTISDPQLYVSLNDQTVTITAEGSISDYVDGEEVQPITNVILESNSSVVPEALANAAPDITREVAMGSGLVNDDGDVRFGSRAMSDALHPIMSIRQGKFRHFDAVIQ